MGHSLDLNPPPLDLSPPPPPPLDLRDAAVARVPASSRGQISPCCNGFFYIATYDFEYCNGIFLVVTTDVFAMLQYVSVASISCCSSCSMLL